MSTFFFLIFKIDDKFQSTIEYPFGHRPSNSFGGYRNHHQQHQQQDHHHHHQLDMKDHLITLSSKYSTTDTSTNEMNDFNLPQMILSSKKNLKSESENDDDKMIKEERKEKIQKAVII
ncbi:hypothetical protein LOAG_14336 [Loa loa]|uniref:Uncharacterized protein n=1 Tax=Loa loa TaxID=7209 RepID=A0A1S0THW1_LOALO|nr:hypothetical protein LOAG_14336 [Loa loa]EFO14188.2 hypothetical protein LOAG_14336 [Loa loa]